MKKDKFIDFIILAVLVAAGMGIGLFFYRFFMAFSSASFLILAAAIVVFLVLRKRKTRSAADPKGSRSPLIIWLRDALIAFCVTAAILILSAFFIPQGIEAAGWGIAIGLFLLLIYSVYLAIGLCIVFFRRYKQKRSVPVKLVRYVSS